MAKATINLQKESGGIVKISPVDGIGITEVTVPESGELATKEYADLKVALADFIGANQNLTQNGYQKLPGGLIIQWGQSPTSGTSGTTATYPITFPNAVFNTVISRNGVSSGDINCIAINKNTSSFQIFSYDASGDSVGGVLSNWIAIGY